MADIQAHPHTIPGALHQRLQRLRIQVLTVFDAQGQSPVLLRQLHVKCRAEVSPILQIAAPQKGEGAGMKHHLLRSELHRKCAALPAAPPGQFPESRVPAGGIDIDKCAVDGVDPAAAFVPFPACSGRISVQHRSHGQLQGLIEQAFALRQSCPLGIVRKLWLNPQQRCRTMVSAHHMRTYGELPASTPAMYALS